MMPPSHSGPWMILPAWISASTGPHDLIPERSPKVRPITVPVKRPSRPDTLRLVPQVYPLPTLEQLGITKRAPPPPDAMRVTGQFMILGMLFFSLTMSWLLGG